MYKIAFIRLLLAVLILFSSFSNDTFAQQYAVDTSMTLDQIRDSARKKVNEFFDEILDLEVAVAALQTRHISNVGYGLDNVIGLNGELHDTFKMLRTIVQSELFIKSAVKYDHFWTNLINRSNYSPNDNELSRKYDDELYFNKIYFDVTFTPAWDTVRLDVDAAREKDSIAWICRIDVWNTGTFTAEFDPDEMDSVISIAMGANRFEKIKHEASPVVNESMFAGLGWLAEKFGYEPFPNPTNIKHVEFTANTDKGFDSYNNKGILANNYDNISIAGKQYYVPWHSATTNGKQTITLKAHVVPVDAEEAIDDSVTFVTTAGAPIETTKNPETGDYTFSIASSLATGGLGILAQYSYTDSTGKEVTNTVGQVNLSGYTLQPMNVVVVPVNSISVPFSAKQLQDTLNSIYGQAATSWTVTFADNFDATAVYAGGGLDDGESGLLTNYSDQMNDLIDAYKDKDGVDIDKETCYLFLVDQAKSGTGKCGYMPLKRQFGFIFANSECSGHILQTFAHELGHGPFRLYHTFSDENEYTQSPHTTDNLMDYKADGKNKRLYKYQWDLIHDPQTMLFAFMQDESEGAYIYEFLGKKYETLFDKVYSKNYTLNTEYYDKIQGGETNNFAPEFTDDELKEFSEEEKTWIKKWEVRARKSNDALLDVIDAIQTASAGDKMSKIVAQQDKIYIVKCNFDDYDFNVAIYGNGEGTTLNKIFTKVVVGKIDDLSLEDNKKHLYVDVNEGRDYWILALFEDGKKEPSLIVQISGKYNVLKAEKWLTYLNIINPKLATLDKDPNFDWMEDVNLDDDISEEELANIIENRNSVNDRTDKSIYGDDAMKSVTYNGRTGYMYKGEDKAEPEISGETEFEKEVKREIYNEIMSEGGFSSINTYDGEIFTWGKGFAINGQLRDVLKELYENADFKQIFNNVGIKIVEGYIWILDSEGSWKKDSKDAMDASNYIKSNTEILSFFIELAEKEEYSQTIANVQYNVFESYAADYPSYILKADKNSYADNWSHESVTVLTHLSHWLPAYSWSKGERYKGTKGDLDKILYEYIYNTLVKASIVRVSPTLETNIYRWSSNYDILGSLGRIGNPDGAGLEELNSTWNNHTIEIEFKTDDSDKLRAVKKSTKEYISNTECVLIKKDNKYIVVTKDGNTISYVEFKEKEDENK